MPSFDSGLPEELLRILAYISSMLKEEGLAAPNEESGCKGGGGGSGGGGAEARFFLLLSILE